MLVLIVEVCVWRNVKVGEVGDEVGVAFAGARVWSDVDPPDCGLCVRVRLQRDCSRSRSHGVV